MAMADVTVLGAGIFGLSVAWACARRGARVRVIDPNGVGAGCSGGLVGALAPHVPEQCNEKKAFQFESLVIAEGFWGEVEAVSGLSSGYARLGRLQPVAEGAALELARARAVSAAMLWQGQAALLALDRRDAPQLFADAVHVVPHGDGPVAVGSTSEREYDDPVGTDAALEALIARARAAVPALRDAPVIARWAGLRPRARSRAPVLGAHPLFPAQFIANGGFKIGFGMAPKVGQVMADLMLEGRDGIPEGFRPESCL